MSAWHAGTRDDKELREKGHDVDVSFDEPIYRTNEYGDSQELGTLGDTIADKGPRRSRWPPGSLLVAEQHMASLDLSDAPLDDRLLMPYLERKLRVAAGTSKADPTNAERQARYRARRRGEIPPSVTRDVSSRRGSFPKVQRR
jgi:hypothetical protein